MKKPILISAMLLVASLLFVNCESTTSPNESLTEEINSTLSKSLYNLPDSLSVLDNLSEAEEADLLYMVEEEKLAHDIYSNFFDRYGLKIFKNIAKSEANHMAAIQRKLALYNLEDPTENKEIGIFNDQSLQKLYNSLLTAGSASDTAALKVGALIEETDIVDLTESINELEGNSDITRVYASLLHGSSNHLTAFVRYLYSYGVEYVPQVLDETAFDRIINSN